MRLKVVVRRQTETRRCLAGAARSARVHPQMGALRAFSRRRTPHHVNKQAATDGHRVGAVRNRSQLKTKIEGEEHWTKRDKESGQFMDQKADEEKFKGVRKEG